MLTYCSYSHFPIDASRGLKAPPYAHFGCKLAETFSGPQVIRALLKLLSGAGALLALFILSRRAEMASPFVFLALGFFVFLTLGLPLLLFCPRLLKSGAWLDSGIFPLLAFVVDFGISTFLIFGRSELFAEHPAFFWPYGYGGLTLLLYHFLGLIEATCRRKVSKPLHVFREIVPQKARQWTKKNQEIEVEVENLQVGDVVKVYPGEIIPVDGVILSGTTSVDESVFTDEQSIFLKEKGQTVVAASLNRDGIILVQIEKPVAEHFVFRLIADLERIVGKSHLKARGSQIVPWLLAVLLLAGTGYQLFQGLGILAVFFGLFSFFSILGLYAFFRVAPLVIVLALGQVSRYGVHLQEASLFRKMSDLSFVFFHKTGVLTRGEFVFSRLLLEKGVNQGEFLSTVFSLESLSRHSLSEGMKTHPWYVEISTHPVTDFTEQAGLGLGGKINERGRNPRFAAVGNSRFLKRFQMQISRAMREKVEELELMGETVILCGWDRQVRGLISFSDTLRPDVKELLARLKKLSIESGMITGDQSEAVSQLAQAHGLSQVYNRCLPDEKARKIENRRGKGKLVGMVGNDADEKAAFAAAGVSFFVGAGAHEVGVPVDVIIRGKRLLSLTDLITYARAVNRTLVWGGVLTYGVPPVLLSLTLLGFVPMIFTLTFTTLTSITLSVFPLHLTKAPFNV